MKERTARDATVNYRAELEQRFGVRPALCEINALTTNAQQRKPYQIEEGVALIEITGVLTNDAWWWDETEYGDIQREVAMAAEDPDVAAILLRINSPGGETDNAFETQRALLEARKSKPMWAVADNIAYSAGYLLASAAERIYVAPVSGGVGSIGVYQAHFDYSGMLEKAGVKVTLTSAGKGKTDANPYEPLSDAAKKKIRAEVDRLYGEFVAAVSRGRKLDESKIREMGAALFNGAEAAIASGLADKSGLLEDAWIALAAHVQKQKQKAFGMAASAAVTLPPKETAMSVVNQADAPAPVDNAKLVADATAAGLATAQEIADLCELAGPATLQKLNATVGQYLEDVRSGKKTVADIRRALLEQRATAGEEGGEISNASLPATAAKSDPQGGPLMKAVKRLIERSK